ncbi:MAG: hypothetical protein ACSW8J_02720 [bacterium]
MIRMILDYAPKKRCKVTGEFDPEGKVMYYDMTTAVESSFRVTDR